MKTFFKSILFCGLTLTMTSFAHAGGDGFETMVEAADTDDGGRIILLSESANAAIRAVPVQLNNPTRTEVRFEICKLFSDWRTSSEQARIRDCETIHQGLFGEKLAVRIEKEFPRTLESELEQQIPDFKSYVLGPAIWTVLGTMVTSTFMHSAFPEKVSRLPALFGRKPGIYSRGVSLLGASVASVYTLYRFVQTARGTFAYRTFNEPRIRIGSTDLDIVLADNHVPLHAHETVAKRVMSAVAHSLRSILDHETYTELR